ncbi:hypothetical protein [Nonomuraea sp. NPDC046570]|uniref:hypothetical protein n=1 Tax=Nonomuraea sp. NPDC046570 TaxID=3155255 RepID=UPI0033D1A1D8
MPDAVRHLIGAVAGGTALPLVYYLTEAGAKALREAYALLVPDLAGLGYLAAVVLVTGLLACWPWLSPLAALVCGLPLAALGAAFASSPDVAFLVIGLLPPIEPLTGTDEAPGLLAGVTGLYLVVGAILVVSAAFPGRWRARELPL